MASSQHRPGAKVSLSPAAYAKDKMKRVENLETQLHNLSKQKAKNDDQASKLRMQLCEVLSDVILATPLPSFHNDCIGRLWRGCFYSPISIFRQRIAKEKKKKDSNGLAKWQKMLAHFIQEAITLYEYLVESYQKKLLPDATQQSSQSQSLSQSSFNNDSQQSQPMVTDPSGVVPCLFRMYIHLGDLYRYDGKYKEAQLYYGNASKLSPGRGNPYNQIAVVAQLKDTLSPLNALALYWYARSLLTPIEPFEISKANLARLFQSNREWFHKQKPPPNKGPDGGREMPKAQRSVASRHFLSQFVNLHFSFFQGIAAGQGEPSAEEVVAQIEAALTPLSVLLRNSAFGDPLLCKMVAICAFSEAYQPEKNDKIDAVLTKQLARMFTLSFGTCLAERVAVGLAKIKDQPEKIGKPGKAPSSVRLLQPLLLVCEYVQSCPIDTKATNLSPEVANFCETTVNTFWQKSIDVLNFLTNLRGPLNLNTEDWQNSSLKEFNTLIGFSPFERFLKDEMSSSREDGYASVEEAVEVLELNASDQSSQQSAPTSVEEYKVKVSRLLAFGDRMVEDSTQAARRRFGRNPNGSFVWKEAAEEEDFEDPTMMDSENLNDTQPLSAGNDKGGDDVLVYSVPQGGGPALLVPGMLLQNRAMGSSAGEATRSKSHANSEGGMGAAPMPVVPMVAPAQPNTALNGTVPMAVDPPPPPGPTAPVASLMPPPGFGGGTMPVMSTTATLPQGHVAMPTNLGIPNYAPGMGPPPGHASAMPPGFGQSFVPATGMPQQQQSYQPTVANSMHLFGGPEALKTANPFAAASMPPMDASGNMTMMDLGLGGAGATSGQGASFLNSGGAGVAESTLLGSGLLNSLFDDGGDKTTQNPFAT